MRGDDDLAGSSLWEVARESREVNLRGNVSLTSNFVNLQLEVTSHDSVLETVRIPLQRACSFMSRFCGPGELLGDGSKDGVALEEKVVSLEREVRLKKGWGGGVVGGHQPSYNDDLRVVLARLEVLERGRLG